MATLTTYDLVGIKEDVSDIISNISPTKTPFISKIGSEKPTQTLHQWQEDSLRDVDLGNARIEGVDPTVDNGSPTVMRHTYIQHMDRAIKVSDIADIVSKYGRNKELALRLSKASAELKRGLEAIVLSGQTGTAGSSVVAPKLDSYQAQVDAQFRVATGSATDMPSEAQILSTLQGLYTEGADPNTILVTPGYSVELTTFSKAAGRYREIPNSGAGSKAIVNAVELFVSPFGEQTVY
uniref:SU10 major capsid protein n=1 Tax=Methylobacterium sp. B34 TaxID=95563 RepID=UPI001651A97E